MAPEVRDVVGRAVYGKSWDGLSRKGKEALFLSILSAARRICPLCGGQGWTLLSRRAGNWTTGDCSQCNGRGHIAPDPFEEHLTPEQMIAWAEASALGMSHEERERRAARLGAYRRHHALRRRQHAWAPRWHVGG